MNEPETVTNTDPDFALAMGLAWTLMGGASLILEGIGAILAGDVLNALSDYGRVLDEHPVHFATPRDPAGVVEELEEVLARMLTVCDSLDEALRITKAREIAEELREEVANRPPTRRLARAADDERLPRPSIRP